MRTGVFAGIALLGALGTVGCGTDSTVDDGTPDAAADVQTDAPDTSLPPMAPCGEEKLAGGCTVGHCRLTAPRGTVPLGATVGLVEKAVPAELALDAVGGFLCDVALPQGALLQELSLAIGLDGPVDAASALFLYKPQGGSALLGTSSAQASGVAGIVTGSGTFGVTKRSGGWTVDGYTGVDVNSTKDPASVLRNIATSGVGAAFWDGTRLYVGNGARLLVYKGLPTSPGQAPDMVLGQADLNTTSTSPSSSVFRGGVTSVWSDGTKLVVGTGSRILVWNTLPKASFTPADLVLGQPDFSTDISNNGGVSATSLQNAAQIDSDGTRLAVSDLLNHRVLLWDTFPVAIAQPATSVIGQPSFTSNGISVGAAPIYQAWGVALAAQGAFVSSMFGWSGVMHVPSAVASNPAPDFSTYSYGRVQADTTYTPASLATLGGGLAVRDYALQRIGVYKTTPAAANPVYDFVLGQPDAVRQVSGPVNGASFAPLTTKLSAAGTRLLVPDRNRLLVFDAPSYHHEPASFVLGQAGLSTNLPVDYRGIGATTLASPAAVAVSAGKVAVADRGNNRVTIYNQADLTTAPASAKVVVGQPDAKSYVANGDIVSPTAARLSGPAGVALDATHLVVADTENHRVLIWSPVPTTTGTPANVVLGQADFTGRRPNHGRGDTAPADGFSDTDKNGMFYPTGVATDGTHLVVADRMNHRVLVWNTIPTVSDAPADAVLGQPSFTANQPDRGIGPFLASPNGLDLPSAVAIRGTAIWVADTENNRAVRFANAFTAPAADAWLGQPDGATVTNLNYYPGTSPAVGIPLLPPTSAASVLRPLGVVATDSGVYVSERDSNRVHVFDPTTLAHVAVLGQATDTGATANGPGIGAGAVAEPSGLATDGTTLFAADAQNHRVLGWNVATAPATGAFATTFVGQASPVANGFNQASAASGGTSGRPHGLARFGASLYVADTSHHRVLVLATPPKAGDLPTRVIGQPDANLILPNAGGAPSARSLQSPRGVFADAARVVVADTGNHRVLVFDAASASPDASLVLGQTGFDKNAVNAGGAPALATLRSPEGVYVDGTRLFVADTGNSRVLVWNTFPTSNGQPADLVLGQVSGGDALPNHGAGAAGPDTLANPSAVDVAGGALFVADAGNNRVLRFAAIPTANGASATSVLGQLDLTSRGAASSAADKTHLAGPVALAHDGANEYVVDRDQPRVVVFSLPADGSGAGAASIFGAGGGLNLAGPTGVAVEPTAYFTSRLYVADTNDDRVVLLGSVSRLLGQ